MTYFCIRRKATFYLNYYNLSNIIHNLLSLGGLLIRSSGLTISYDYN